MGQINQLIQGFTEALSKLSARPIPLDKEKITEYAQRLIQQSGTDSHGFLAEKSSIEFTEPDMKGQNFLVVITLRPAHEMLGFEPDPSATTTGDIRKFIAPDFTQSPEAAQLLEKHNANGLALIEIYVNDFNLAQVLGLIDVDVVPTTQGIQTKIIVGKSGEGLNNAEYKELYNARIEAVVSAISHELTHLKDPVAGEAPYQDLEQVEDMPAYVSQPVEVRAFMQQLIQELNTIHQPGESLFDVLNRSVVWKTISPHLADEAKKKMLQAVYTWFVERNQ